MFTLITNSLCCRSKGLLGETNDIQSKGNLYRRERLQTVATVIDILIGIGLFTAGIYLKNTAMIACGAIQTWPLFAFITLVILGCKDGVMRENIYVRFRPCCPPTPTPPNVETLT
jgi:hypothetical protein